MSKQYQRAFEEAKRILHSDLLLAHYDLTQKLTVGADGSNSEIGAVILHRYSDGREKAIYHASKATGITAK